MDVIKLCINVYLMVLVQNRYKNTLVVTHSSPSCYVTLRTQVTRLNSGNLNPQKTYSIWGKVNIGVGVHLCIFFNSFWSIETNYMSF